MCLLAGPPKIPCLINGSEPVLREEEAEPSTAAMISQAVRSGATDTPVRSTYSDRSALRSETLPIKSKEVKEGSLCYSPPSPYALNSSPSPPSSAPHSPIPSQELKRRRLDCRGAPGASNEAKQVATRNPVSSKIAGAKGVLTTSVEPAGTPRTPKIAERSVDTSPSTPDSGSGYRRVLDPAQISPRANKLPRHSPISLMSRFEATYKSLKSKPPGLL